ncbi:MAG: Na+/H+ antiporter subunit E [Bacteroidota bacterium]
MKFKAISIIFVILFAAWLILNQSAATEYLLSGALVALAISFAVCRNCSVFDELNLSLKSLLYTLLFLGTFLGELVKANFDMAKRVLSPSLPIKPGIIKATTTLQSKMARLILANSITLTPGTFTIDIIDDTLYIHCVYVDATDPEQYGKEVIRKFEKYLEVIYG